MKQTKSFRSKNTDLAKAKNLANFKKFKNSAKCKKLIKNLVKLKISERLSFLNSATKLAYI